MVAGFCDQDCSDFDLAVGAPDGSSIGQDVLEDDAPIVNFQAPASGVYTIVASMPGCSIAPCLAAVRVYRLR